MNCDELRRTLSVAMKTEKLGTVVAARVHVQFAATDCELSNIVGGILWMLSPAFNEPYSSLRVRGQETVEQSTLLLQTATGKTVCITVGSSCRKTDSLKLLIIGNHGIARLTGGDRFEWNPKPVAEFDFSQTIRDASDGDSVEIRWSASGSE